MISRSRLILAICLATGIPLLLAVLASIYLWLRVRALERSLVAAKLECETYKSYKEYKQYKDKMDSCDDLDDDMKDRYLEFVIAVSDYIRATIHFDSVSTPLDDLTAQIRSLLFTVPDHPFPDFRTVRGQDLRIFPNPHEYSPEEIAESLLDPSKRTYMLKHIVVSVFLHNVSSSANVDNTLLRLNPGDLHSIGKLRAFWKGTMLAHPVISYICKYGLLHAKSPSENTPARKLLKERLDGLVRPFLLSEVTTESDIALEHAMDKACVYGMRAIAFTYPLEITWGERRERAVGFPALDMLVPRADQEGYSEWKSPVCERGAR